VVIERLYDRTYAATREDGFRVLVEEVPGSRSASIGVWVNVGSRDDPAGAAGMAHFLEHLLFKGTTTRDSEAISREIDSVGGHLNAATGKETTFYYADLPAEGIATALDLLSDLVLHPAFEPEKIELERTVVLEEIRGHEDDPEQSAFDRFAAGLWAGEHPLSRPILGASGAIERVERAQIAEHHRLYYRPGRMVLVASGAVDHGRFLEDAERLFPPSESPAEGGLERIPPVLSPGRRHHERLTGQTHVYLGLPGSRADDEDRLPLEVANAILGDGTGSRLFRAIREDRGLAYAVGSGVTRYTDGGFWLTYAAVAPPVTERVIDLIKSELRSLAGSLQGEEIALAKARLRGAFILGLESNAARAARLGAAAIEEREILSPDAVLAKLDAVGKDDIYRVLSRFNRPDMANLTTVGPTNTTSR